jgi:hypothetical protein
MKQKKSRLMMAAVAVILLAVLISSAIGKYVTTVSVPGKVTFTAKLAGSMVLQEHKAERNADGSYTLTEQIATADENGYFNGYDLIPGLDIPKDPHIVITGKTDVKAYLFVEVVENGAKTQIKDVFGFEMITQNRFTTAQIDMVVWTEEMLDLLMEFIQTDERGKDYRHLDWSEEYRLAKTGDFSQSAM